MHVRCFALMAALLPCTVAGALADGSNPYCALNTGLDPSCPLTAAGVQTQQGNLPGGAVQHGDETFGQFAWGGRNQVSVTFPWYRHLDVPGAGNAYGTGDASAAYDRVFGSGSRLWQVAQLAVSAPSGAPAFTDASWRVAPSYGVTYALGNDAHLVVLGRYAFDLGGTTLPFAPRTQALSLIPRAIVDLPRFGVYAAVTGGVSRVTGDQRYDAYGVTATLGALLARHVNLSASYGVPLGTFTYDNLYRQAMSLRLAWQP